MTYKKANIELLRKVWDEDKGVSIKVSDDPINSEEFVLLTTTHNEESMSFYGDISLIMPKHIARLVGQALINQSEQL